ncbi:MAG: DUF4157 domain-containing protein [Methanotrichaceae archaeon]|nr:DUF4157 domain-containing protein [Methanotrichaceae archaeon]
MKGAALGLQAMPPLQRAAAAQRLQQTRGNGFVTSIQAKMTVGPADDSYEQEADRVAERVMRMPDSQVLQHNVLSDDLQRKPTAITRILRQVEPEEEEEIQLKGQDGGFSVPRAVEARLEARQGGGQPLSNDVRGFMEPRFGADFSDVRLHSDPEAVGLARGLGARAFTRGQDIYMEGGQDPRTDSGQRLIAHELTHVVQQGASMRASLRRASLRTIFRAAIQRRKDKSRIRYQNDDWSHLPKGLKDHIMNASINNSIPKGLHAYTQGNPPDGVTLLKRIGRENAVHTIWWTHRNAKSGNTRYAKWSTMFPKNFTEGMVAAILTKAVNMKNPAEVNLRDLGIPGGEIEIEKKGDTMYPFKGHVPGTEEKTILHKGVTYSIANNA